MSQQQDAVEQKVVVFQLGHEEYAVPVQQVKTIEKIVPLTRVPRTPEFVKGVVNLRGVVTPVIDLRGRFGLPEIEATEHTRMIVVSLSDIEVAMIVDSANDVLDIPQDSVEAPPEVVGGIRATYLNGIAKLGERLIVILNLGQVLKKDEILQLEQLEGLQ